MAYDKFKRDYTLRGGKDAEIMNKRQMMGEHQHNITNNFVKNEQEKQKHLGGQIPKMEERYMKFDACMVNNGAYAQNLAKHSTNNIDHLAFPVRQQVDESQD